MGGDNDDNIYVKNAPGGTDEYKKLCYSFGVCDGTTYRRGFAISCHLYSADNCSLSYYSMTHPGRSRKILIREKKRIHAAYAIH